MYSTVEFMPRIHQYTVWLVAHNLHHSMKMKVLQGRSVAGLAAQLALTSLKRWSFVPFGHVTVTATCHLLTMMMMMMMVMYSFLRALLCWGI